MATTDTIFAIRRVTPEEALRLNQACRENGRKIPKSYTITNDGQRFELLDRVLNQKATIKEASRFALTA
jgi:hypothetical protein